MGFVGKHAVCMLRHVAEAVNYVFKLSVTFWEKKILPFSQRTELRLFDMDVWVT